MKKKSWEIPQKYQLPRFGFIFKSGNSPLENQYFSTQSQKRKPTTEKTGKKSIKEKRLRH